MNSRRLSKNRRTIKPRDSQVGVVFKRAQGTRFVGGFSHNFLVDDTFIYQLRQKWLKRIDQDKYHSHNRRYSAAIWQNTNAVRIAVVESKNEC